MRCKHLGCGKLAIDMQLCRVHGQTQKKRIGQGGGDGDGGGTWNDEAGGDDMGKSGRIKKQKIS